MPSQIEERCLRISIRFFLSHLGGQATIAFPLNNKQLSRVVMRSTRETRASKLVAKERRAVAKASKVPPPSREMQLNKW
jgi:hypothetical protein